MELDKQIAYAERKFLGGMPKVERHNNQSGKKQIDLLNCENVPQNGVRSCATIGLNRVDIGLSTQIGDNIRKLRIELVGACDVAIKSYTNIMATVAFNIMDTQTCFPGYIVEDAVDEYIVDSEMKHVLLYDPFLWESADVVVDDEVAVTWLMLVPISDQEYQYARTQGIEKLVQLFEKAEIDVYNIYRSSVV